jgi:hypothetical protein
VAADKSETLLEHAKREMEEAYARANKLREVYYALGGGEKEERDRFLGLQRWRAIYELLREKPEQKAAVTDILRELQRLDIDLGKYPLRTIKNALTSPYTRDYFKVERIGNDEVVQIVAPLDLREADGSHPL